MLPDLKATEIRSNIVALSNFFTRYYTTQTGRDAAVYLHKRYKDISNGRADIGMKIQITCQFF